MLKQQADAAGLSAVALQKTVICLVLMFATSIFFDPPSHFVHWVVVAVYTFILFSGYYGASKRLRGWLTLYWVSQFLILILTLVAIVYGLAVLIGEIKYNKNKLTIYPEFKNLNKSQVTNFIILNVLYLFVFLVILALKVRSILLAQKMAKQLQELPYLEDGQAIEYELDAQPQKSDDIETPEQQPTPQYFPQPVFVAAGHYLNNPQQGEPAEVNPQQQQPFIYPYPMMFPSGAQFPVLVDQFGNPITHHPQYQE